MTAPRWTDRDLEYARLLTQDRVGGGAKAEVRRRWVIDADIPGDDVEFELMVSVQMGQWIGSAILEIGRDPHDAFRVAEAAMNRARHFGKRPAR